MQTTSHGKNDKYLCRSLNGTIENKPQQTKNEPCRKKSPLRIQNDWSEHISSKGLIYYYNCRTEVSQWQKPIDWTLSPMAQDEIKRILKLKQCSADINSIKRNFPNSLSQDSTTSPKRIKFNNQQSLVDTIVVYDNNNCTKLPKNDNIKFQKVIQSNCNFAYGNNNKNKHSEANFNNDDMDISPSSSPLSRGSHSDDLDAKKKNASDFEIPAFRGELTTKPANKCTTAMEPSTSLQTSPTLSESFSVNTKSSQFKWTNSCSNHIKCHDNSSTTTLTQYQLSLATVLRSTLNTLQSRSSENRYEICLSVANISELLTLFESAQNNGGTINSYRSHRLQTQLLQSSSYGHCSDPKSVAKLPANISQIKELVKYIQDFIQDNYHNSTITITPVSPNYSKTIRIPYYLQILQNLVETCLMQLCPQTANSPSSTSSPGSLKDNNSSHSLSTSVTPHSFTEHTIKTELESPIKREKTESDRPKSVLTDPDMLRFVSGDLSNSYRNQLADCYVNEAQTEYYKFVRLHSVLYPELACESKKLKALVRISEINTELFRHKKEDIEKMVRMLEGRRLPSHLTNDCHHPSNTS